MSAEVGDKIEGGEGPHLEKSRSTDAGAAAGDSRESTAHNSLENGGKLGDIDYAKWTNRWTPWNTAVTPFESIVNAQYEGKGTKEEPFLIGWLDEDPENPMRKSELSKWGLTVFVSVSTLAVSLASSAYSGAVASIKELYGGSQTVITLGVSLFVLGFALGPLIWAPLSEVLGRRYLFVFSYFMLTLWNAVAVASPNLASLLVFRFLAGAFGSSPLTNAGGTIADCFNAKERGLAMAVFAAAPFMGPALGPITGGFIGDTGRDGIRWVMAFLAFFTVAILVVGILIYSETYAPVLLRRRAAKLNKATGNHYIPRMDKGKDTSIRSQFSVALSRPWMLLIYEPIVLLLSLYVAIVLCDPVQLLQRVSHRLPADAEPASFRPSKQLLYAASVLAANSVVRSLLGAAFPLFTPYMYHPGGGDSCPVESCGIHVGPAIAGALALLFLPAPFYFYKRGAAIRQKCKFSAEANKMLQMMMRGSAAQPQQPRSAPSEKEGAKGDDIEKTAGAKQEKTPIYNAAPRDVHDDQDGQEHLADDADNDQAQRQRTRQEIEAEHELHLHRSGFSRFFCVI
ncbi:hypothetical protein L7F22_007836 [Adiantum nelumboides]|nr:hypothetical protein [Adiantum nelumboides]